MGIDNETLSDEEAKRICEELEEALGKERPVVVDKNTGDFFDGVVPDEVDPEKYTALSPINKAY